MHWPLIVFAPFVGAANGAATKIAIAALTILAAWLTKRLVEDPARTTPLLTACGTRFTFAAASAATAAVLAVTVAANSHVTHQVRAEERVTERVLAARPSCFGAAARDPERRPCENPSRRDTARGGQDAFAARVAGLRSAWRTLPASVRRIIVLRDTSTMPGTTPTCVEQALSDHRSAATACDAP